jgi:hypothetical protein
VTGVQTCALPISEIYPGVYIVSRESMLREQIARDAEDSAKLTNLSAHPFWVDSYDDAEPEPIDGWKDMEAFLWERHIY